MRHLYLLTLIAILFSTNCFSQKNSDCNILKHCKLLYTNIEDSTGYIIINGNNHIEFFENGKYFIKSKLDWVSDCEYNATMTEITLPNFPFKPGEKMNVKIDKIEGGKVYCKLKVRDYTNTDVYKIVQ